MKSSDLFLIPFALQAIAILVDEFYFHHRRGLPRWERWGHPLDTLTVVVCYAFLIFFPVSSLNLIIFSFLAGFSCLFVTKDEFVHKELCSPGESWLHAVLFILHPVCFFIGGILWSQGDGHGLFVAQATTVFIFLLYQVIYWSVYVPNRSE